MNLKRNGLSSLKIKVINVRGMNNKFKALVSIIAIVLSAQIFTIPATAGNPQKPVRLQEGDVKILASGTSTTENEAVTIALRSALEQAFGTFVSANTTLVNDALVKDEIVSITTGNIKHYDIINSTLLPNGNTTVLLNAIVSTNNLVKYAQNHGSSTELAGNKLALAMRLEQMNIKNQRKIMNDLFTQLSSFVPGIFDYEIEVGEPKMSTKECRIPICIKIKSNNNTLAFQNILKNTLASIPNPSEIVNSSGKAIFHYLEISKELYNASEWDASFFNIFNLGIIPQLTAFCIIDQNDNVLGLINFSIRNKSDYYNQSSTYYLELSGKIDPEFQAYQKWHSPTSYMYPSHDFFKDHDYGQTVSKKPISFTFSDPNASYYRFYLKEYDEQPFLLPSLYHDGNYGHFIYPFPEITETTPQKIRKKTRRPEDEKPASDILFSINGLTLVLDTDEINRISEIKIVPLTKDYLSYPIVFEKKLLEMSGIKHDARKSDRGQYLELFLQKYLEENGIKLRNRQYEDIYGVHLDSDGTIIGSQLQLPKECFTPMRKNGHPVDCIILYRYWSGLYFVGFSSYEEKNEKVIMLN